MQISLPLTLTDPLIWLTVLALAIYLAVVNRDNVPNFFKSPVFKGILVIITFLLLSFEPVVGTLFGIIVISSLAYSDSYQQIQEVEVEEDVIALNISSEEEKHPNEKVGSTSSTHSPAIEDDMTFATIPYTSYVTDEYGDALVLKTASNQFLEHLESIH